ncbi:MAG: hypothetical protein RL407_435, partial [Bacteroidota bacterium]
RPGFRIALGNLPFVLQVAIPLVATSSHTKSILLRIKVDFFILRTANIWLWPYADLFVVEQIAFQTKETSA